MSTATIPMGIPKKVGKNTVAEKNAEEIRLWPMPIPDAPSFVRWYSHPDAKEYEAAIVVKVHNRMIDVAVFIPGNMTLMPKMGVRHRDDPDRAAIANTEDDGVWDLSETTSELRELMQMMTQNVPDQMQKTVIPLKVALEGIKELKERMTSLEDLVTRSMEPEDLT